MIKVINLRGGYGACEKLHGLNLCFHGGQITAVVGPNGSGKSTLLKTICGLLPMTGGSVELDGRELAQYSRRELSQAVAFLPQSRNIPNITVGRMVLHGRFPYLGYPRRYSDNDYKIVEKAIARAGISGLSHCSMEALSGGERQKVYLAMALAQETSTILLDEPTTFLDMGHQLEVMKLADTLKAEGKTVVLVLHDLNLALRSADRVAVLQSGNVMADDTPENIVKSGTLDRVFEIQTEICKTAEKDLYYAFSSGQKEFMPTQSGGMDDKYVKA